MQAMHSRTASVGRLLGRASPRSLPHTRPCNVEQAPPCQLRCRPSALQIRCPAASQAGASTSKEQPRFGIFVCSGSPAVAEAVGHTGIDWMCIDAQHGAVGYEALSALLAATSACKAKRIVRVGGPSDRFGIQQALDLGADGVMVPLINTAADAELAVSCCKYPSKQWPKGLRSIAYPVRAAYRKGLGKAASAAYLREANDEAEVWLQVETKQCFDNLEQVFSAPGIDCAFLGPADMSFSMGLPDKYDYDLAGTLASPELNHVYSKVLKICADKGIQPGVFCLGEARARQFAEQGYVNIAYDVDLNVLINHCMTTVEALRP